MTKFLKKPIVIILIIIIIGVIGYSLFSKKEETPYDFVVAEKKDLIQEVSVTGRVKPTQSVDLAFEKSGKVNRVYVEVGDKVRAGQLLTNLSNTELAAQLRQAEANVESAQAQLEQYQAALEAQQAKLDELERGSRSEDIQIKQAELKKAQQDLDNYYNSVADILNDAHNKADDALKKQIDELFSNDSSSNPQLTFIVSDTQAEIDAERQRVTAGNNLSALKSEVNNLPTNHSEIDTALDSAENYLIVIRIFLARSIDAVGAAIGITQTTINTYKGYVTTARTNINTAISNINTQEEYIAVQKFTVEKVQNELNLKLAGTAEEQIAAQEALVKQAQANVNSQEAQIKYAQANVQKIQAQIQKTIISSPIAGIITKQDAKVGEIVSANTAIISVISSAKYEIEVAIPEADIAKVKVGDKAKITLDAYGDDVIWLAEVITINPAETLIEGVVYYRATLVFDNLDERIKAGMSANVDIITAEKENVLAVPQRAVIRKDNQRIVRILKGEDIQEVAVETGLMSSQGEVEIISGVNEGDKVITFVRQK